MEPTSAAAADVPPAHAASGGSSPATRLARSLAVLVFAGATVAGIQVAGGAVRDLGGTSGRGGPGMGPGAGRATSQTAAPDPLAGLLPSASDTTPSDTPATDA